MYRSSSLMYLLLIFLTVYLLLNVNPNGEITPKSPLEKENPKNRIKRELGHVNSSEVRKPDETILNACCGRNQMLDDNLECVDRGESESNMETLVGMVVVNEEMEMSNGTRMGFSYGRNGGCSREDVTVIKWNLDTLNTFYISAEDGSLLTLDENRKKSSSFNVDSYCLDEMSKNIRSFVGLLCPCNDRTCIPKCCENGYYFDTLENKCKLGDGVGSFKPTFYKQDVILQDNESWPYFLKYRSPKCYKPDELIIKGDANNDTLIYLQLNGFLMVDSLSEGTYYFYDSARYCLDIFSNGTAADSRVNGFHCAESPVVFVYKHYTKMVTRFTNAEIQEFKEEEKKKTMIDNDGTSAGPVLAFESGEERLKTDSTTTLLLVAYVLFVNVILFDM